MEESPDNRRIRWHEGDDKIHWGYTQKGFFTMKEAYDIMTGADKNLKDQKWKKLWKTKLCPKITIFSWLVLKKIILPSENLKKRGMDGSYQCFLCELVDDTIEQILDTWKFMSYIQDYGAEIFHRSD